MPCSRLFLWYPNECDKKLDDWIACLGLCNSQKLRDNYNSEHLNDSLYFSYYPLSKCFFVLFPLFFFFYQFWNTLVKRRIFLEIKQEKFGLYWLGPVREGKDRLTHQFILTFPPLHLTLWGFFSGTLFCNKDCTERHFWFHKWSTDQLICDSF